MWNNSNNNGIMLLRVIVLQAFYFAVHWHFTLPPLSPSPLSIHHHIMSGRGGGGGVWGRGHSRLAVGGCGRVVIMSRGGGGGGGGDRGTTRRWRHFLTSKNHILTVLTHPSPTLPSSPHSSLTYIPTQPSPAPNPPTQPSLQMTLTCSLLSLRELTSSSLSEPRDVFTS